LLYILLRSHIFLFSLLIPPPPRSTLFPYTTLFRSDLVEILRRNAVARVFADDLHAPSVRDRAGQPQPSAVRHRLTRVEREVQQRSEEHTSELQSRFDLVCRLLLEKKKKII